MSIEDLVNESLPANPGEDNAPLENGVDGNGITNDSVTDDTVESVPNTPLKQNPQEPSGEATENPTDAASSSEDAATVSQPTSNENDNALSENKDSTPTSEPASDPILDAILNKIVPVKSKDRRRKLKVLIYSEPGAGKSVLAGTAPNNLFIDAEDGLISLDNHPDLVPETVYAYPYKSFPGLEAMVQKLNEAPPELAHIETVTMDTVSEIHKRGLAEVTEREYWAQAQTTNRYLAETEHHTENNEHIRRLVSSLRDLDRNLILLSHSRTVEPKNRPAKTFPDFSEKLANTLAGIVDIVAYMYLKEVDGEVVRVLQLQGDGIVTAKTRIGGYPREIVNPKWSDLWDAFLAAQSKHDAAQS